MKNILLLNSTVDHAFGFFRSFERLKGYNFFWADSVRFAPARKARCCKKFFRVPAVSSGKAYIDSLLEIVKSYKIDIILPIGEYETKMVAGNIDIIRDAGAEVPVASERDIILATDKLKLTNHCSDYDINYPNTVLLKGDQIEKSEGLTFPVIVKQRSGTGQRGLRIINNKKLFQDFLYESVIDHETDPFIIQEFIPGYDHENMYSVGLIFNRGTLVSLVPLKKIRAQKFTGGTCTASYAVNDPELIAFAERIGGSFPDWHGIMDIEIKKDPRTDRYMLIEINPRPWGCMYGAMAAGVDFPRIWLDIANNRKVEKHPGFSTENYAAFFARDSLLLFELLVEILFGKQKRQALSVLRTFKFPYFVRRNNRLYSKTSDFVISDIRPLFTNIARQMYNK